MRVEDELKALMIASLGGDAGAYRSLLGRLTLHLRAYYKRRLPRSRGPEEAEDLVQETLLAIHLKRHTFDVDALFTPWAYAIARYKLIDHIRKQRHSSADVPMDDYRELVASDDYVAVESAHDLDRLLYKLPNKTRRMIEAVKLKDRSISETAMRYGISESNVKITIHRGLKGLAGLIGGQTGA